MRKCLRSTVFWKKGLALLVSFTMLWNSQFSVAAAAYVVSEEPCTIVEEFYPDAEEPYPAEEYYPEEEEYERTEEESCSDTEEYYPVEEDCYPEVEKHESEEDDEYYPEEDDDYEDYDNYDADEIEEDSHAVAVVGTPFFHPDPTPYLNIQSFSTNLLTNGDFAAGIAGWTGYWGGTVLPNDGLSAENTSAYMLLRESGWNGVVSDIITITEPGTFRLSAWGRAVPANAYAQAAVLLTHAEGQGRNDAYRCRYNFTNGQLNPGLGAGDAVVNDFGVQPSRVFFTNDTTWAYRYVEFQITPRILEVFQNQFRVAIHAWGAEIAVTGITLERVIGNPCLVCDEYPCVCPTFCTDCSADPCECTAELATVIAAAQALTQANFTPDSWATLVGALGAALSVFNNSTATGQQIEDATTVLQAAIDALQPAMAGQHPNALAGTPFGNRPNPQYAFDGEASTVFVSTRIYPPPPQDSEYDPHYYYGYIGLDFGSGNYYRISNIRVLPHYVTGQSWILDRASGNAFGSVDGIEWVHIGVISGTNVPSWRYWEGNATQLANRNELFRYVRIVGLAWWDSTFAEIEIFGYVPAPCVDCDEYPCVCPDSPTPCVDCGAYPCLCTSVLDTPPGVFGVRVYHNDFSAPPAGGFTFGHGGHAAERLPYNSYFLRLGAAGGAGVTGIHYSRDTVLVEGNLYVLSITYRTDAQASGRRVGLGAPGNAYEHWLEATPEAWQWSEIQVPVSQTWATAYMVFTASTPSAHSPAIFLGRQYGGLGHGTWDIYSISIYELDFSAADKAALAAVIAQAETITDQGLYTPGSWVSFQTALNNAIAVYNNPLAEQTQVDSVELALQAAMDGLALRTTDAFRTMLLNLINQASAVNSAAYTPATFAALGSAIAVAQGVHDDAGADIPAIRTQLGLLQAAMDALAPQQQSVLLPNGDFSLGTATWYPGWAMSRQANTGQNALNTSSYMARVTSGWNRIRSDVIVINEPGWYRLSGWGMTTSPGPLLQLFLTYEHHSGASEHDGDFRWLDGTPHYWAYGYLGRTDGSRVATSVVDFSGESSWIQLGTAFELTQELIDAYNGRFRVVFRTEGNSGDLYITGMTLERVCDDCHMEPCICNETFDRTALATAIATAEVHTIELLYTPATWAALQSALSVAQTVYLNQFVLQAVINLAASDLVTATINLTPRTTVELRVLLDALITQAELLNEAEYRPGTWTPFYTALATARAAYANNYASEMMLVNAYLALQAAMAELVEMPPSISVGDQLFDDRFSRHTTPNMSDWIDSFRVSAINPIPNQEMAPAIHYMVMTTDWSVMRLPVQLQGNVRYRMSAWVYGHDGNINGVFLGPPLGTPGLGGNCGPNLCHNTWCGCESHRIGIHPVSGAGWTFRYVEFVLDADLDGEVMLRSWPGAALHVSDIRIEVLEVFDSYGVTFGAGPGGALTAAVGQTAIQHGSAVRPNTVVTFTATPNLGFTVDRWVVDGAEISGEQRIFTATVTADMDVRVFFRPAEGVILTHGVQGGQGEVIARANGRTGITSGTVVPNGGAVSEGFSIAFTATPAADYEVKHWIVNGEVVHFIGRLFTVVDLQGVGSANALTFDAQVVFQPIDPTGGRFDPYSSRNVTNRGRMGININRGSGILSTSAGLNSVVSETFLASMAPFGVIRFMNYTNTNGHFVISDWNATEEAMWGEVIAISNATNADIWVCIPVNASDAYIQTLANMLHTHLNPNIRVYVEWGNEVWGFENQQNVNRRMATEAGIIDNRPAALRNPYRVYNVWWYFTDYFHFAQRTAEIAFIFRDVFNEDSRPIDEDSRVRPVVTWQVIPNAFEPMWDWLNGVIPLEGYPDWHPNGTPGQGVRSDTRFRNPHEYIWAVGIAPYFSEPHVTLANDVDTIHRHMLNSIEGQRNRLQAIIDNAAAAGLVGGAITYEGGPHYVTSPGISGDINLITRTAAQDHPTMVSLMNYYIMNFWFDLGGGIYTHYRHLGAPSPFGHWGVKNDMSLEQFKFATKYESLSWISQQTRETIMSRPELPPPPPFANPITNPSFEGANPANGWNLGPGWSIDTTESIDGFNSMHVVSRYREWQQTSWGQTLEVPANTDLVLSFWHKGMAGYKVIIRPGDGREYYVITGQNNDCFMEPNEEWTEYLISFNTGNSIAFELIIGHEWNGNEWRDPQYRPNPIPGHFWDGEAWFDFFHLDENLIYNPSFERGMDGWGHGLGWIGAQAFERVNTQAQHLNHSLRIYGEIIHDGLNTNQFTFANNTRYRFLFYHMGDGGFRTQIPITSGLVDIVTEPKVSWARYETWFTTAGMSALTGNVMTSSQVINDAFVDNFMLFQSREPVPGLRHTVTFNLNYTGADDHPPMQTINNNGRATAPTDPTRTGHDFVGWFICPDGTGTAWDFAADAITESITLYADWLWTGAPCVECNLYPCECNAGGILLGDVNNDGYVNTADILYLRQYVTRRITSLTNWYAGDMNQDGFVNAIDLDILTRYVNSSQRSAMPAMIQAFDSVITPVPAGNQLRVALNVIPSATAGYIYVEIELLQNPGFLFGSLVLTAVGCPNALAVAWYPNPAANAAMDIDYDLGFFADEEAEFFLYYPNAGTGNVMFEGILGTVRFSVDTVVGVSFTLEPFPGFYFTIYDPMLAPGSPGTEIDFDVPAHDDNETPQIALPTIAAPANDELELLYDTAGSSDVFVITGFPEPDVTLTVDTDSAYLAFIAWNEDDYTIDVLPGLPIGVHTVTVRVEVEHLGFAEATFTITVICDECEYDPCICCPDCETYPCECPCDCDLPTCIECNPPCDCDLPACNECNPPCDCDLPTCIECNPPCDCDLPACNECNPPVTVTVTITSPNTLTLEAGFNGQLQLTATVVPAANATFALTGNVPEGVTINADNRLVVPGTLATGTYTFTITATSGDQVATQAFTLVIMPWTPTPPWLPVPPQPPVLPQPPTTETQQVAQPHSPQHFIRSVATAAVGADDPAPAERVFITAEESRYLLNGAEDETVTIIIPDGISGVIFDGESLQIFVYYNNTLIVNRGRYSVTFTNSQLQGWNFADHSVITLLLESISLPDGTTLAANPQNQIFLHEFANVDLTIDDEKMSEKPAVVGVLIYDLGLSAEQLENLVGVRLDERTGNYELIEGEISADGRSFMFPITEGGMVGIVLVGTAETHSYAQVLNSLVFTADAAYFLHNQITRLAVGAAFIDPATDRMMIPLRTFAEATGLIAEWCSDTRSARIYLPDGVLIIPMDEELPDGMGSVLIVDDRAFVPLRFVMYAFDADVQWDSENRSAVITWYIA